MTDRPAATPPAPARWGAWQPVAASAGLALVLRGVLAALQWRGNRALRAPSLDAAYYLDWASAIAAGDLASAGPAGPAGPYLLNPLYAWVLAPVVGLGGGVPAVLVLQALLGGLTAAVAALAARRVAGRVAAWCAGFAVAFSTSLAHLATHVSVATLASLLVALAFLAAISSARRDRASWWSGLWLGLGALARPVTLLALPFVMAGRAAAAGNSGRRRSAAIVLLAFAACALVSLGRNVAVSGEPVVFTAANGQNLHLGGNPLARRTGSMLTDEFRFAPTEMHVDARHRVALEIGREPSPREVSDWYATEAWDEWRRAPLDSLRHALLKAAWFATPDEPPSSADLRTDRERVPWLRVAFVPTWLLVALAAGGLWLIRRERPVFLAGLGLVGAHWAACTAAFPLSHYRAPVVPVLAVLAAVAVTRWRAADRRGRRGALAAALAMIVVTWAVPAPGYPLAVLEHNRAVDALAEGRLDDAEAHAARALADLPAWTAPRTDLALVEARRGHFDRAEAWARDVASRRPWVVPGRRLLADVLLDAGRPAEALAEMDALVAEFPWSAEARGARGRVRAFAGDADGARTDLAWAMARGHEPDAEALRLAGLPPR